MLQATRVAQGFKDHAATLDVRMGPGALGVWPVEVQAQGPWLVNDDGFKGTS